MPLIYPATSKYSRKGYDRHTYKFGAYPKSGGPVAAASYNFLSGALASGLTFARASGAWYTNASGVLTQSTANTPRFDYNPATLALKGLLVEEQRTNLCLYSGSLSGWVPWNNCAVATAALTAPDGTTSCIQIADTATNSYHRTYQSSQQVSYVSGQPYTFSVFAKQATHKIIQLHFSWGVAGNNSVDFDLNAGAISNTQGSVTGAIYNAGNGWFRCSISCTSGYTGTDDPGYISLTGNNPTALMDASYAGSGNGVYFWGGQVEAGGFPTSYIPTTNTTATRAADSLSLSSPSWFNATQGTFLTSGMVEAVNANHAACLASFSDRTTANVISSFVNSSGAAQAVITTSGTTAASAGTAGHISAQTTFKQALAYKAANNLAAYNAAMDGAGTFGASGLPSGINALRLGDSPDGTQTLNGWLRQFTYWNSAMTSTQLQTVTT